MVLARVLAYHGILLDIFYRLPSVDNLDSGKDGLDVKHLHAVDYSEDFDQEEKPCMIIKLNDIGKRYQRNELHDEIALEVPLWNLHQISNGFNLAVWDIVGHKVDIHGQTKVHFDDWRHQE